MLADAAAGAAAAVAVVPGASRGAAPRKAGGASGTPTSSCQWRATRPEPVQAMSTAARSAEASE